jgi:molybdenum cofactor cytidylyltransferase
VKRDFSEANMTASISAIILAAGTSERMGNHNKLLLPFKNKTILETVVDVVLSLPFQEVLVVAGHDYQKIRAKLQPYPLRLVYNRGYASGLSASLKKGVSAAQPGAAGILICLGDMPFITPELLAGLAGVFGSVSAPAIVVPVFEGRRGNPVIFSGHFREKLLEIEGDRGARPLIDSHPEAVVEMPVSSEQFFFDVDTMEAYRSTLWAGRKGE